MRIDGLTQQQIISLALLKGTVDYVKALDYDAIDWLTWSRLHKN